MCVCVCVCVCQTADLINFFLGFQCKKHNVSSL